MRLAEEGYWRVCGPWIQTSCDWAAVCGTGGSRGCDWSFQMSHNCSSPAFGRESLSGSLRRAWDSSALPRCREDDRFILLMWIWPTNTLKSVLLHTANSQTIIIFVVKVHLAFLLWEVTHLVFAPHFTTNLSSLTEIVINCKGSSGDNNVRGKHDLYSF